MKNSSNLIKYFNWISEPITTIVGGPDLYIDTGSTVNLTCIVRHLPEPPPAIYWTHNNEVIYQFNLLLGLKSNQF